MIKIKIHGLKETQSFLSKLPANLNKEVVIKSEEFMRFVQKSAKLRAPRDTGFLASQIKLTKSGMNFILDTGEAYYAYYQEFGFRPHIIPFDYFKQHLTSPNIPGQYSQGKNVFVNVSNFHPFLFPALEVGLSNLPNFIKNGLNNAIKKSGR